MNFHISCSQEPVEGSQVLTKTGLKIALDFNKTLGLLDDRDKLFPF